MTLATPIAPGIAAAATILLASLPATPAQGAGLPDFPRPKVGYSATRVLEMQGTTLEQKVYHEQGKERAEMAVQGTTGALIVRPDLGLVWMLVSQSLYMEASTADAAALPGGDPTDFEIVEFSERGLEQVDGHHARRYDVRTRTGDGSIHDGSMWLDAQNIPVRVEAVVDSEGKRIEMVMRLRALAVGDQPDHLFEPPAGAQKIDLGGAGAFPAGGFPGGGGLPTDSPGTAAAPGKTGGGQPGLGDQMGDAAKRGAVQAAGQEVQEQTRKKVRKGLRRIFD